MNEEEKEAIEIVQGLKVYYDDECLLDEEELIENKTVNNAIDTLINLVEKQQKELEEYKEMENVTYEILDSSNFIHRRYIPKNLVKESIIKYDNNIMWNNADDHHFAIKIMKELLEE